MNDDSYASFLASQGGAQGGGDDDSYEEFRRQRRQDALAAERRRKRGEVEPPSDLDLLEPKPVQPPKANPITGLLTPLPPETPIPATERVTSGIPVARDVTATAADRPGMGLRQVLRSKSLAGAIESAPGIGLNVAENIVTAPILHPIETAKSVISAPIREPFVLGKYAAQKFPLPGADVGHMGEPVSGEEAAMAALNIPLMAVPVLRGGVSAFSRIGASVAKNAAMDARFASALDRAQAGAARARATRAAMAAEPRTLPPGQYEMGGPRPPMGEGAPRQLTSGPTAWQDESRDLPRSLPPGQYEMPEVPWRENLDRTRSESALAAAQREAERGRPRALLAPSPEEAEGAARAADVVRERQETRATPDEVELYRQMRDAGVGVPGREIGRPRPYPGEAPLDYTTRVMGRQAERERQIERAGIQGEGEPVREAGEEGFYGSVRTKGGALRGTETFGKTSKDALLDHMAELVDEKLGTQKGSLAGAYHDRLNAVEEELGKRGLTDDQIWNEGLEDARQRRTARSAIKDEINAPDLGLKDRPGFSAIEPLGLIVAPGAGAVAGAAAAPEGKRREGAEIGAVAALGLAGVGLRGLTALREAKARKPTLELRETPEETTDAWLRDREEPKVASTLPTRRRVGAVGDISKDRGLTADDLRDIAEDFSTGYHGREPVHFKDRAMAEHFSSLADELERDPSAKWRDLLDTIDDDPDLIKEMREQLEGHEEDPSLLYNRMEAAAEEKSLKNRTGAVGDLSKLPEKEPERITGVAMRDVKTGKVWSEEGFEGGHGSVWNTIKAEKGYDKSSFPNALRGTAYEDGFVTSTGRYVPRDEGLKLAKASHQWNGGNRAKLEPSGEPGLHTEALKDWEEPEPIETKDGMRVTVRRADRGGWNVVTQDMDSGEYLPTAFNIKDRDAAIAKQKEIAGIKVRVAGRDSKVTLPSDPGVNVGMIPDDELRSMTKQAADLGVDSVPHRQDFKVLADEFRSRFPDEEPPVPAEARAEREATDAEATTRHTTLGEDLVKQGFKAERTEGGSWKFTNPEGEYAGGSVYGESPEEALGRFKEDQTANASRLKNRTGAVGDLSKLPVTETEPFKRWFGKSQVVDEEGKPRVLYHGTTHDFDTFEPKRTNPENDWGQGIYLTSSAKDVSHNYAGLGPDLTNRIELAAERIQDDPVEFKKLLGRERPETWPRYGTPEYEALKKEVRDAVKGRMTGHEGAVMPVYASMRKPFVVGGPEETRLTFRYNERTGNESGTLIKFIEKLREVASDFGDAEPEEAVAALVDRAIGEDGVSARDVRDLVKEHLPYATDDEGNLAHGELLRKALEESGFDGVIDHTVNERFGTGRKVGKPMEGMDENTVHYVAFHPEQVKSSIGNTGKFSRRNPSVTGFAVPHALLPVAGVTVGATVGAATGKTPEERRRNAVLGAVLGAGLGSIGAKALPAAKEIADRIEPAVRNTSTTERVGSEFPAIKDVPTPKAEGLAAGKKSWSVGQFKDAVLRLVNPTALSKGAEATGGVIREEAAQAYRENAIARAKMRDASKMVGDLTVPQSVALWDAAEHWSKPGVQDVVRKINPELVPVVNLVRAVQAPLTKELTDLGILDSAIEDYVGRYWFKGAREVSPEISWRTKAPLEGPKSFAKHRTYESFVQGLRAGETPLTYNFVDAQMLKMAEQARAIAGRRMVNVEEAAGRGKWVTDPKNKPTTPDGRPWIAVGELTDPAFVQEGKGRFYVPPESGAVWKNHLTRGIASNPIYQALMAPSRAATQVLLGLSGFHATTIATEAAFSEMARGIESVTQGELGTAAKAFANAPGSVLANLPEALKIAGEYEKPGSYPQAAPVLDAMIKGGYRLGHKSEFFQGDRMAALKKAVKELREGETAGTRVKGALKVAPDAVYAAIEQAAVPVLGKYVPLQKLYATYRRVSDELGRLPADASDDVVRARMGDIVNEMDYRFGQVIYDNHFVNRTVKDVAQLMFLAPGWTFGTLALAGRGITRPLSKSGAYWLAAFAGTAMINGALTYGLTGEKPEGMDYLAFRDGSKDEDGNANRNVLPGYIMKDLYGWSHHPVETAGHKLSPGLSWAYAVLANRRFNGDMVYDPHSSDAVKDIAKFTAENFTPLTFQNYAQAKRQGEKGAGNVVRNVFGITPARREATRTEAQNLLHEYIREGMPSQTPEEQEAAHLRAELRNTFRREGREAALKLARDAMASGKLTRDQVLRAVKQEHEPGLVQSFKRLQLPQAEKVWSLGTEHEKRLWAPTLLDKRQRARAAATR